MPQPSPFHSILLNTLATHTAPVNALLFSSSPGTYILTGSSDRQIHLSRALPAAAPASSTSTLDPPATAPTQTKPIQTYSAHGYEVLDLAVASDNAKFASAGGDRLVFLWDVEKGITTRRFGGAHGHSGKIQAVEFAGSDTTGGETVLVSGSYDSTVRIWDLKSNSSKPIQVLEEARDAVSSLHIRGGDIVAGSVDNRLRTYDLRMGRVVTDVLCAPVTSVRVTRDGQAVLVSTLDSKLRLIDRESGACLKTYGGDDEGFKNENLRIRSCLGLGDSVVVSGSEIAGEVWVWDLLSGDVVQRLMGTHGEKGVVSCVAWNDGAPQSKGRGGTWASGGSDGGICVWSMGRGGE